MKKTEYILTRLPLKLTHSIAYVSLLLLPFTFMSCGNESDELYNTNEHQKEDAGPSNFSLTYGLEFNQFIDNSSLYLFNSTGPTAKVFKGEQKNIKKEIAGNIAKLTTVMEVGTWDLVILGSENNMGTLGSINVPNPYATPPVENKLNNALMWTTSDNGTLQNQTPILVHSVLPSVAVAKENNNPQTTQAKRLVAKIVVDLGDRHVGFAPANRQNGQAYVQLLNVPNKVRWDGVLYPNSAAPSKSSKPLRSNLVFTGEIAGKLEFVIPADAANNNKITLGINMMLGSATGTLTPYYKEIVLETLPRPNKVLPVKVKQFSGEPAGKLDVNVKVVDWKDYNPVDEEVVIGD